MLHRIALKKIYLVGIALLILGPILACLTQSTSPSGQGSNSLPATPTRIQTTNTVSIPEVNHISPELLAPIIYWDGWGAGGFSRGDCGDGVPNVDFKTYNGSMFRLLPGDLDNEITFGEAQFIEGCDFPANEYITVNFLLPDGNSYTIDTQSDEECSWYVLWIGIPGDPKGQYDVDVTSNSGIFSGQFFVSEPTEPTMLVDCYSPEEEGVVLLTGFQPNEEVLIARYETYDITEYFYVTVDQDGVTYFNIPNKPSYVVAIGQEITWHYDDYPMSASDYCK